jgi:NAD(P)-dependent dehydrogenase (short-subunit alcohol dehydrogenase family)
MDLNLRGKTALITGASKGIGLASAECLAEEGVNVILVSRTLADLEGARARIASRHNVNVQVHAYDLSDSGNIDKLVAEHAGIDILVNNAGAIPAGDLQAITEDRWRQAWDLKVFGYISFCRVVYDQMKARKSGVIINVIGAAGESFPTGYIAGAAGNAALMAFTRALGKGAPADGLRVVAINPGPVETDRLIMLRKAEAVEKWGDESRWRELSAGMPFGRAASPAEIGNAVAFLASPASGYTTGTVLTINGGG